MKVWIPLFLFLSLSLFQGLFGQASEKFVYIQKAPETEVFESFEKWIQMTELVLADKFEYRKSPYKNKRYALLDLRDKFLRGILKLALLQRIERPSLNFNEQGDIADRLEISAHQAFYDAFSNMIQLQSCLFFPDARFHKPDSYVAAYSATILPCAREDILDYDRLSSEAREKERESGLRSNDQFRTQMAEEIYDFRSEFMKRLGDSDILFPKIDPKNKDDREKLIYVLEYLVLNASHEQTEKILEWSVKDGRFRLVKDPEYSFYLLDILHDFLTRFVQNGGPHDDLENLEAHCKELIDTVRDVMAR